MLHMALKAVGFDIDGTLYPDYRIKLRSIWFILTHFYVVHSFYRTRHIMRTTKKDTEDWELEIYAQILQTDLDSARDIRDRIIYKGWEYYFRNVRTYSGVCEALLRLKEAGLKLAVLSDFPVGRKLEYLGLTGIFDVSLGFPESKRLKPHSQPFTLMAEKLDIDPRHIIYIGNKLDYDVQGAKNSGMRGALIGRQWSKPPTNVTVYPNYRKLVNSLLAEVET